MDGNDRQSAGLQEAVESEDRAELRRAAHKIAWTRMNGSIDAANPFVEARADRFAPEGRVTGE